MVEHAPPSRAAHPVGWWVAALVAVPLVLALVGLFWPGPQLSDDLRQRSEVALAAAGFTDVSVRLDGRDAELGRVPVGAEAAASAAVAGVTGIREVQVDAGTVVAPAEQPPAAPPVQAATPELSPTARTLLVEAVATAVAAAPITFSPDSAELAGPAAVTVQRLAELLVASPAARVDLEGHVADTPGGPEVAQQLSERRAAVVGEALVAGGVAADRITTRGAGAEQPLATPAASRRVEIRVQ